MPDGLEAGRDAIRRFAWREAFELLTEADRQVGLPPEDLEALGEAAWWVAQLDTSIAAREKAYAGYLAADDRRGAARVALAVAKDHFGKGSDAVGSAWIERARKLLAEEPEAAEHGWLARMDAVVANESQKDYEAAIAHAAKAIDVATRFKDKDLLALSLHDRGTALVGKGDVDEGWGLIDEATVAAVSGELKPYYTAAIYCNTITVCTHLGDYRRAGEWSEAARRWCERQSIAGFPGMCRVYRAEIMLMRGAWAEAEREARAACEELEGFNVSYAAEAFYGVGEVRLHLGDLGGAEEAFKQAHRLGRDPEPGMAIVQARKGRLSAARSSLDTAREEAETPLGRARFLPAYVEIALAEEAADAADAAAADLVSIASTFGTPWLGAAAAHAVGLVRLHRGHHSEARSELRRALRLWQEVDAPYDAARSRFALGKAIQAAGDTEGAALEIEAAVSAFEELGALHDLREASQLLNEVAPAIARPGATRATKTFMFTDIVRSTDLVTAIGDDAWHDLLRWHDQTLRGLFAAHNGEEVDHAGDGFFVCFAEATSAVTCAVAIQRKFAEHRRAHGFAPQVRIGLHETVSTRSGTGYKGKGVHEAARIGAAAEGGEIIASAATAAASAAGFSHTEERDLSLKGMSDPVTVVSIDWR